MEQQEAAAVAAAAGEGEKGMEMLMARMDAMKEVPIDSTRAEKMANEAVMLLEAEMKAVDVVHTATRDDLASNE
ncbi:hypothetical protein FTX61_27120, partial [Nitriliruptoraceae bacterium ZYF776]|nr:hypothetical protein [Profundirhabdus halotolerans]